MEFLFVILVVFAAVIPAANKGKIEPQQQQQPERQVEVREKPSNDLK